MYNKIHQRYSKGYHGKFKKLKRHPKKSLQVYYQNMGGMRSKLSSVYLLLQQSIYDIIVLSETWLSGDVLDTEVCPAEYNIYRADRNSSTSLKSRGGGVAIMVR